MLPTLGPSRHEWAAGGCMWVSTKPSLGPESLLAWGGSAGQQADTCSGMGAFCTPRAKA